jgi:hypothetical protein
MSEKGNSDAGGVIGIVLLLAVLGWIAAVLGLPHMNMSNHEVLGHSDAMYKITAELGLHRTNVETVLVPKSDSSLDIFISRTAFESVPYPDRDELDAAISDIWCNQVSTFLLPAVHFRDVQTGSTLATTGCLFQSSPEITGDYSGTVHNNTANVDSTSEVQLVKTTNGVKGCMQVALPLVGTGPISGTLNDRSLWLSIFLRRMYGYDSTELGSGTR